jgi:hypothetical protein
MYSQRRDDSQACPFVQHTLQTFGGEAARMVRWASIGLLHDGVPRSSRTSPRRAPGQFRRCPPWPCSCHRLLCTAKYIGRESPRQSRNTQRPRFVERLLLRPKCDQQSPFFWVLKIVGLSGSLVNKRRETRTHAVSALRGEREPEGLSSGLIHRASATSPVVCWTVVVSVVEVGVLPYEGVRTP